MMSVIGKNLGSKKSDLGGNQMWNVQELLGCQFSESLTT